MNNKWKWVRKGCSVIDGAGRKIADINIGYTDEDMLNERGNVIAAAPDMLDILEKCLTDEERRKRNLKPNSLASCYSYKRIKQMKSAIAKAKGEK